MPYRSDNPFYYSAETVDADHLLSKEKIDKDNFFVVIINIKRLSSSI